jgi:wobble nucleotide-excising tRNase
MTLLQVSRLRDCGVFRNFSWPTELPDFGRYNIIYGWNGSGKTTLSRLLRALELRKAPQLGQVTVRMGDHNIVGSDFPQVTLPIRVFNRDFVNESIFPTGGGDVPPIYIVGKENVERQKEADRLKQERIEADSELNSARARNQNAERALDRYCQDRARVIKDTLRSSGQNPFNNYNKADFRSRAEQMVMDDDAGSHCLNDAEYQAFLAQHKATPMANLAEIVYRLPNLQALADTTSALLRKTVVSAAIQCLKDDAEVADWTRHGLCLHNDRNTEKCMFCEQPLPEGRLAALEAHFSAEYEQFMREIDNQITQIESIPKKGLELILPSRVEFYNDIVGEYEAVEGALRNAVDVVGCFVRSLGSALEKKRTKAFEALRMELSVPEFDTDVVAAVNMVIRKHNQASEDFETRISSARKRLAMNLIATDIDEFKHLHEALKNAIGDLKTAKEKSEALTFKIKKIEDEIIEHRQPAEDLNNDLRHYLGHSELQLAVKETGYTITRNGETAQMLSEGEMTAIALLYFLKSLEGRDFDLANGVVVFDDPVSSLDANAMHLAFSLMRNRTTDAGQLFVLTHNFAFFRQVRNWLRYLPGQKRKDITKRPARFYMLECVEQEGKRESALRLLDPLLYEYESEYHFLFSSVYRFANGQRADGMEACYGMPNVARRLLESFLAFRHPQVFDDMWGALREVTTSEESQKSRILNFVQTNSHGPGTGQPEHDPSILGESKSILQEILALIESEDSGHYTVMKNLVDPAKEVEGTA